VKENKGYFKKGFYNRKQIEGFPTLKQFILLEKGGKRCLVLRFANETEIRVDHMKFVLTQLNAQGKVIKKSKVEYRHMRLYPEQTYAAQSGIVVMDECVDFRINILYVISDKYKYVAGHGKAVATYDIRGYDGSPAMGRRNGGTKIQTVRISPAVYKLIAAFSLVLVVLSCCFVFFRKSDDRGNVVGVTDTVTTQVTEVQL